MTPDWTLQDLDDGGQVIHWRGYSRLVNADTNAAMMAADPEGHQRLCVALARCTEDGFAGDICRFDVQAWIATGRCPIWPKLSEMH